MEIKTTNQLIKDYERQDSFIREHEFTIKWVKVDEVMKYVESNEYYNKTYFIQQLKRELSQSNPSDTLNFDNSEKNRTITTISKEGNDTLIHFDKQNGRTICDKNMMLALRNNEGYSDMWEDVNCKECLKFK
jgi:hypothetical protein